MPTDVRKITESRKAERDATINIDARSAKALEQIADTIEAIRSEIVGLQNILVNWTRKP